MGLAENLGRSLGDAARRNVVVDTISTELILNSSSYIFDGAGGMRDQLEQFILKELQVKHYPIKTTIQTVKTGSIYGFGGTKEQCITVELATGHRIVISNTTVGSYLYVCVYRLMKVFNTENQIRLATAITDIFDHQHTMAAYWACVAACEAAFEKLQLKQSNSGYHPMTRHYNGNA